MRFAGILAAACLAACSGAAVKGDSGPDLAVILADRPAATLAEYGLFLDAGAREPAPGVHAYDLVNPLFSDHAAKHRFVFTAGKPARYEDDSVFAFPAGSVLVKSFSYPETGLVETRLLIRKPEGWVAYPYVWNADQTEARYAPVGAKRTIETADPAGEPLAIAYSVPNQNQCKTCHRIGDEIMPIGPKARNLDHDGPNGENQIGFWTRAGLLAGAPEDIAAVPALALLQGDTASRARAYLDINCAHCHRNGGSASNSGLWLDWSEDDPVRLGLGKHPTAAGRGAGDLRLVVAPGEPDASILLHRMASTEPGIAMPELSRTLVDEDGLGLIRAWIAGLDHGQE